MKMHILSGGRLRMRSGTYFADSPKEKTEEFPCVCVLLRHRNGNVLFDTGCHPDVETDAAGRWGGVAKAIVPVHAPGNNVIGSLKSVGLTPDDIDVVVNSHLHMDHCGCNGFFKKAEFFVHARELEVARNPDMEGKGYYKADWEHPMPVEAVEGQKDIFDDNRIVLLPLPGHTQGTMGALVELDNRGSTLLAADALSVQSTLTTNFIPRNNWNNDLYQNSLDEIRKLQASGTGVICGHDEAQWQELRKGADSYD
jgi:glyoxylase-like metal-dependent hydrolase (beta-lactamase superfamily II)